MRNFIFAVKTLQIILYSISLTFRILIKQTVNKQVNKLPVPIKHVYNSLGSVKEKKYFVSTVLYLKQRKIKNSSFLCQLCLTPLHIFDFCFLFYVNKSYDRELAQVKHLRGNVAQKIRNTELVSKNLTS